MIPRPGNPLLVMAEQRLAADRAGWIRRARDVIRDTAAAAIDPAELAWWLREADRAFQANTRPPLGQALDTVRQLRDTANKLQRLLVEDAVANAGLRSLDRPCFVGATSDGAPAYLPPLSLEELAAQLAGLVKRAEQRERELERYQVDPTTGKRVKVGEVVDAAALPEKAVYILVGRDLPLIFAVSYGPMPRREERRIRTRFIMAAGAALGFGLAEPGDDRKAPEPLPQGS